MKSFYVKTASFALAFAALVSCQAKFNEVPVPEEGTVTETLELSFEDANPDPATKVEIATGTGKFSWSDMDQVAIWYQNGNTGSWSTGPITAKSRITVSGEGVRAKLAVYPASARSNFNMTAVNNSTYANITKITYPTEIDVADKNDEYSPMPMIALNDPSRSGLKFYHVGGLIRFKLYGIPKGTMYIKIANTTTDTPLAGDFPIEIPTGNEVSAAGLVYNRSQWAYLYGDNSWTSVFGSSHKKEVIVKITKTAYTAETNGVTINLPVPLGVYDKLTITALNSSKAVISTVGSVSYVAAVPEVTWDCERATGRYLTAQALRPEHPMILPTYVHGQFSVSASKKVWFASGNLVVTYHSTTNMDWAFEDTQYNPIYYTNNGNSYETDGQRISHFGWGTGDVPYKISTSANDYRSYNEWGKHFNAKGEGLHSRTNGTWYTLSMAEFNFLIRARRNADLLVGKGMIHTDSRYIKGLVLLKDDWESPLSCKFRPGIDADYSTNIYTTGDHVDFFDGSWQAMEEAGALFLPAVGNRSGVDISNEHFSYGYYWSSSGGNGRANGLLFDISSVGYDGFYVYRDPSLGYSVRLVHD